MSKKDGNPKDDRGNVGSKQASAGLARVRWFNPKPNNEDANWLEAREDKQLELCVQVLEAIPDAGKLSIKYDVKSKRWLAILFVVSSSEEFELDALSVRGADPFSALCLCAYFHLVKFEGAWIGSDSDNVGRWG